MLDIFYSSGKYTLKPQREIPLYALRMIKMKGLTMPSAGEDVKEVKLIVGVQIGTTILKKVGKWMSEPQRMF